MSRSSQQEQLASVRETVESIWVAIVLAFVLRAFVLEAFVIPTGSMAPRLMGRHWQFECPACKYYYAYGITEAIERRGGERVKKACPNCGFEDEFRPREPIPYGGDRVLVLKYLYRFGDPKPWDVVVFKNPQDNQQNYIKRLIGLPGQEIEIVHGDIFVSTGIDRNDDGAIDQADFDLSGDGVIDEKDYADPRWQAETPWKILRKSAKTQEVMWQVVFDNDYQPAEEVYENGERSGAKQEWKNPWGEALPDGWAFKAGHGRRVFEFAGADSPAELDFNVARRWFCPVYGYNDPRAPVNTETEVNSDLKLAFMFVPHSAEARVALHLSSFDHHFRAWVSADGPCRLEHVQASDGKVDWTKARTWGDKPDLPPLALGRGHDIALTHVDQQVTLWVNGEAVITSTDEEYSKDVITSTEENPKTGRDWLIERTDPKRTDDRVPTPKVAILAEGGPSELWHVKVMRDVFYTYQEIDATSGLKGHGVLDNPIILRQFDDNPDMDEFYVLGDNSPQSRDSRMWAEGAGSLRESYRLGTVPRYSMIGKAFFVYWPGGYRLPLLKDSPWGRGIGIVPNVGRMRLIR